MGTTAPENYLICDGSTYNISDYKKLADHIKDNFGSYNFFGGDGETTFAVPDLRGEFLRGEFLRGATNNSVGVHQNQGLPNITGTFSILGNGGIHSNMNVDTATGAFSKVQRSGYKDAYTEGNNTNNTNYASFDASNSNSIYGSAEEVRPTNTSVNYIIKVK